MRIDAVKMLKNAKKYLKTDLMNSFGWSTMSLGFK